MSDPLGEALAWWDDPERRGLGLVGWIPLQRIVAAARNWHTLTNPSDELIDKGAKALAYEAGKDISTWDETPDPFLNPWREKARIVVDALTDTAEPDKPITWESLE